MGSVSATVSFRPLRIGFLVRTTGFEEIVEAARINLCLWGGALNPLIAIDRPEVAPTRLIDLFAVDVGSTHRKARANAHDLRGDRRGARGGLRLDAALV